MFGMHASGSRTNYVKDSEICNGSSGAIRDKILKIRIYLVNR